jgi:shikimate dehydrogenase
MDSTDEQHGLDLLPVTGVLGHAIGFTLSPFLHDAADSASGRRTDYQVFDVPPNHLESFLGRVNKFPDLVGFNVTIPHKEEVARHLSAMHETAREVGAVNTVAIRGDHLIGYNTDRPAVAKVLRAELMPEGAMTGWTVVLLGAGGAARAVAWALLDLGIAVNLVVSARNLDRLHSFANDLYLAYSRAGITFSGHPWLDWTTLFVDPPAMLINATPLGCIGIDGQVGEPSPVPPPDRLAQFALVFDLVYNPPETELLAAARNAGLKTVGGGGMLIEQAVASRSIWFGPGREDAERMAMVAAYHSWASKASRPSRGGA